MTTPLIAESLSLPAAGSASTPQPSTSHDVAISVRNVSKMYPLYARPNDRLKQSLWYALPRFLRRNPPPQFYREFWALSDISFEVKKGESMGIVGRNGSGKSTLLQIIAGILAPTFGEVQVNGRLAALLELGSGFNLEFTGRENVYLNGAILGFNREEMDERFDEIAAFADIGQFMDQPVKHYSSGMFVRLAFAVQACVEPEVFLVDEALAVGDVFFQQKCYRRLENLRNQGTSIILVSHSMLDVEQFCQRALLLHLGSVVFGGGATEAVKRYYLVEQKEDTRDAVIEATPDWPTNVPSDHGHYWPLPDAFLDISNSSQVSNGWAYCTGIALCDAHGKPCHTFKQGETASFFYEFEVLRDIQVPIGGLMIQNKRGVLVHGKQTIQYGSSTPDFVPQGTRLRFRQNIMLELEIQDYTFEVGLATVSHRDYERRMLYSHHEFYHRIIRLCHIPEVGWFSVTFRASWETEQLLHHGVANLPGECYVFTVSNTSLS